MIYPKNPYCPLDNDCMYPGGNNNNNTGNSGNCGGSGNTGNNGNCGNNNHGNGNNCGNNDHGNGNNCGSDNMSRDEMLRQIMELEFAVTDLNLYLDTHPNSKEALEMFTKLAAMLKSLKYDYAQKHEPITAMDASNNTPFEWVSDKYKWPWQA